MTFEEFVGARLSALTRYATVVTWDPHLAADVLQDVLVRARERWSPDDPERRLRRMVVEEFLSRRSGSAEPPSDLPEDRRALVAVVATLPPRERAILAMRYYEELSLPEIADILGCRTGVVRAHLDHATALLGATIPAELAHAGERA